jgi:hypothetical protein
MNKIRPGFEVREKAKGLSMLQIMRFVPLRPDDHNARFVFTATSHNGRTYPRFGRYKGRVAVFFKTLTRDQQKDSPRLHTQLLYARDPDYSGTLIDCPQVVFSCDCLVPQTRLLTIDGYISIEDLASRTWPTDDPHPVSYVVRGKVCKGTVPFFKGIREIIMVTTEDGRTLELTPDHKVLAVKENGTESEWVKAGDLTPGDSVVCDPSIDGETRTTLTTRKIVEIYVIPDLKSDVYDVEMKDRENPYFIAEGIVVHNCERFLYSYEYALWRRGAAEIRFGNGEPPNITNPRLRPGACKHFKRVYVFMKSAKK